MCVIAALLVVWALQGSLSGAGFPVGRAATIAVGMTLQAIPFLLLGVFVAELIEAYLSPALIARVFPTNPLASVLTALLAAFVLPVCDCSAVPIFRSLLRKGVPLSAATTLMLASPAINPLVFASTLYAFGSWSLVAARVGLSVVVALTVGLSMLVIPPHALREESLSDTDHGGDACCCEHGCEMPDGASLACWRRRVAHLDGFCRSYWEAWLRQRWHRCCGRCHRCCRGCLRRARWL